MGSARIIVFHKSSSSWNQWEWDACDISGMEEKCTQVFGVKTCRKGTFVRCSLVGCFVSYFVDSYVDRKKSILLSVDPLFNRTSKTIIKSLHSFHAVTWTDTYSYSHADM